MGLSLKDGIDRYFNIHNENICFQQIQMKFEAFTTATILIDSWDLVTSPVGAGLQYSLKAHS